MISAILLTPSSPGFLYPSIRLAKILTSLGVRASICTSSSTHSVLAAERVDFIKHKLPEETFAIQMWADPKTIATQFEFLDDIIDVTSPNILISSQFCPAYSLLKREHCINLWIFGLATTLWPHRHNSQYPEILSSMERREVWRYSEFVEIVSRAAVHLAKPQFSYDDYPYFYGEHFLVRNIPQILGEFRDELTDFTFIGDCLYEPNHACDEFISYFLEESMRAVYVQHGRHFESPPFWTHLEQIFSDRQDHIFLADLARYDGPSPETKLPLVMAKQVPVLDVAAVDQQHS